MTDHSILLLTTPEQELDIFLPEEQRSEQVSHGLARACVPHCIVVGEVLRDPGTSRSGRQLVDFVIEFGARADSQETRTDYYEEGIGWKHTALAAYERARGKLVVSQNLRIPSDDDTAPAYESGRVSNSTEEDILKRRMKHSGEDRSQWLSAINDTISEGGSALPIITIPASTSEGSTSHGVVVTKIGDGLVEYFDPDKFILSRYQSHGLPIPNILRVEDTGRLLYTQPVDDFVSRMSGEVMHIFES